MLNIKNIKKINILSFGQLLKKGYDILIRDQSFLIRN